MASNVEFTQMLGVLETIFSNENRPGGDEAAHALRHVIDTPFTLPPGHLLDITEVGAQMLRASGQAAARDVLASWRFIDWHHSGLDDGRIRPEIALSMATTELIGPDGMIFHPTVRVGLFMQLPELDYVTRTHRAEETFVKLGGAADWTCNSASAQRREAGAYIHHPSNAPHASVTKSDPLIAAWRWTGDIGYDGYTLVG